MSASQPGTFNVQEFTDLGAPLVGGRLYTYVQGTTTQKTAYTDAAGTIPHTYTSDGLGGQYIALNARGELPAPLYLAAGSYDLALKTAAGANVWTRRADPTDQATLIWATLLSIGASLIGFIQSGVGAVLRTVQDKLRESVSVLDFGADLTGVLNSSLVFQSAINAVSLAGGGRVVAPKGNYLFTGTVTLPSNVQLVGEGAGTVIQFGDGVTAITATGTSGTRLTAVSIQNLTIKKTAGTTGQHLVMTLCDDSDLTNVIFDGALGVNPCYAQLNGTRRTSVDGCVFKNGSSIIWSSDTTLSGGNWGYDNSVTRCRMNAAKQGFDITYQYGFTGVDCVSAGSTSTFGCGFIVEYQNQGVVLTNCVAHGHVRDGFYVEGNIAYGCKDVQFIGCVAYGNGEAGLNLDANFKDVLVSGGAYYSNTGAFVGGSGHGVMASGSESVTITGAAIHDNVAANIVYLSNPYRLTIIGCKIANAGTYGIYFTGTPTSVKISNCQFVSNTSGDCNAWSYLNACEWDNGPWVSWTPTFYKSDNATVVSFTTVDGVYRRNNGRVEYQLYAATPGVALDAQTYFSIPISGTWPASAVSAALRPRGTAYADVSGGAIVDGRYNTGKLCFVKTGATDTALRSIGSYEVI